MLKTCFYNKKISCYASMEIRYASTEIRTVEFCRNCGLIRIATRIDKLLKEQRDINVHLKRCLQTIEDNFKIPKNVSMM